MRIFNRIVIVLNTLLFLAAGIFGVALSMTTGSKDQAQEIGNALINALNTGDLNTGRIIVFTFSLFLVVVALLTIIGNIEQRRTERTVMLESPLGDIMVSLSAIEDFSRVVKNKVQGVKDIKGKVHSTRKGIKVKAYVTLYSDRAVAEATQEIQEAIIQYIQYTLGIAAEIKPSVVVNKIVYKSKDEEK